MKFGRRAGGALRLALCVVACGCARKKDESPRSAPPNASAATTTGEDAFSWPLAANDGGAVTPRKGMIWIPPGTLLAGTPKGRTPRIADEELPGDPLELSGFYIDEFPYPNEAGGIPRTGMTRDEAAGLCTAQDKRLCTELEWERACKGPGNTTYEYGDAYRPAECAMGQAGRLAPSGLRVACRSLFGVHDLHGGPWEWTLSTWRRGGAGQAASVRGGNSDSGEVAGRCANAIPVAPTTRRADIGVRCCAGETNRAEVRLAVGKGKTLDSIPPEPALATALGDLVHDSGQPDLPPEQPFKVDRLWHWHPVGNEELVVAAGCARRPAHLSCGVGIFRGPDESGAASLVGFASSGWWMAVVKTDHRDRDLWVYGGDDKSSFRRRVAYVWGRVALGEAERALPKHLEE